MLPWHGPCTAIQLDADPACGTQGAATSNDLSGEQTLYSSEYSSSLFINYRRPLLGMDFFGGADINYRDDFNSTGDNDPVDLMEGYTKVNVRLGFVGDRWEIMAFGRNIFDEAALQQGFDTPILAGSHTYFMDEGRVMGARLTVKF